MALNEDIKDLLSEFGLKLTVDTKASLKSKLDARAEKGSTYKGVNYKGRKRKSRLENSAKALPITYSGGVLRFTFVMNDYWDVVDKGRKPGSVSEDGQNKISEWSGLSGFAENIRISDLATRKEKQSLSKRKNGLKKLKKMPFDRAKKAAGFLVARSLKKKTIEPTNFFTDIIRDGRIEELQKRLSELIKTDIIINISN
jgi:hypothetical protein